MSLFTVPGWSVNAAPVQEAAKSSKTNPKRKRDDPQANNQKATDKAVAQLLTKTTVKAIHPTENNAAKRRRRQGQEVEHQLQPSSRAGASSDTTTTSKQKKRKSDKRSPAKIPNEQSMPSQQESQLTALQKDMRDKLHGARFRIINEQLYKSDSQSAHTMMRADPTMFEEYHVGFRRQVLSWPKNPVDHYIAKLASYPKRTVVADLGCGDAALAKALVPKGWSVLSFDLVSNNGYVVEADVCTKIPLPGSETDASSDVTSGEGQIVDVVICALSLMGSNWIGCLREAWRVLKPRGELQIAEVSSRFADTSKFGTLVAEIGFQLKSMDTSNSHFTLYEFVKITRKQKTQEAWDSLLQQGNLLKPCEYKRR